MSQAFSDRIKYEAGLIVSLERTLTQVARNRASDPGVRLERRPRRAPLEFSCGFQGSASTYSHEEPSGRRHMLVETIRQGTPNASILMGCRFDFAMEGAGTSHYLTAAGLIFFSNWNSLIPLLRAEWDYRALRDFHAQPHWHVPASFQEKAVTEIISGSSPQQFNPSPQSGDTEKLHLAMGTDWHSATGNTYHRAMPNSQCMRNWIEKTATYSIHQLVYAIRKAGVHQATVTAFNG